MRLINKQMLDIEHAKQKYLGDMNDLEVEEESILQKEVPKLENDISTLKN